MLLGIIILFIMLACIQLVANFFFGIDDLTKNIPKAWLRILLRVLLKTTSAVLVLIGMFSLLIVAVALNTGKEKK